MKNLLTQFVAEECTVYVRKLLEDALNGPTGSRHQFDFNRFMVTIEADHDRVVLEDVLDATEAGAMQVTLSEFRVALMEGAERDSE